MRKNGTKISKEIIHRGGTNVGEEQLFLRDLEFDMPTGEHVVVKKKSRPDIDIEDLIARHIGRYSLLGLFCRPGYRVLDFPCGSGYGADLLKAFGIIYEGVDRDPVAIEYARHLYGSDKALFKIGDLTAPDLAHEQYDTISCLEGLEHIEQKYQSPLIAIFHKALKSGGTLVISSPENPTGKSGHSTHNKHHLWELNRADFLGLLHLHFHPEAVEIVTHKAVLSSGVATTCLYGICHKD